MNDKNDIDLIEDLRDKLHDEVNKNELNNIKDFNDEKLLELSNQLDILILKYMAKKDNKYWFFTISIETNN